MGANLSRDFSCFEVHLSCFCCCYSVIKWGKVSKKFFAIAHVNQ